MTLHHPCRYVIVRAQACHCGTGGSNKDWVGVVVQVVHPGTDPGTPSAGERNYHFLAIYGRSGGRMSGGLPGSLLSRQQAEQAFEQRVREKLHQHGYTSVPFEPFLAAFPIPLEQAASPLVSLPPRRPHPPAFATMPDAPALLFVACRVQAVSSWQPYASPRYGVTEKANGERCLLHFDGERLLACNRRGEPAPPVPAAAERLSRLMSPFVLDGERLTGEMAGHYVIFDLLFWRGMDLRSDSFERRYSLLQEICADAGLIREKEPTPTLGEACSNSLVEGLALLTPQPGISLVDVLTSVRKAAGEGIIIRDLSLAYGELHSVFKYKLTTDLDAIVIGIKPGPGGGSLSLGLRRPTDNSVIAIGQVRSGLTQEDMRFFTEQVLAGHFPVIKVEYLPARTIGVALVEGRTSREWVRLDKTAWECTTDQLQVRHASLITRAKSVPGIRLLPVESASPAPLASRQAPQETLPHALVVDLPQSKPEEQPEPEEEEQEASTRGRLLPLCVESLEEYASLLDVLAHDETVLVDVRRKRAFGESLPALTPAALRERWGMKYVCLEKTLGNKHEHRNWNGACELALPEQGLAVLALLLERGMKVVLLSRKQTSGPNKPFSRQVEMILDLLEERGTRFVLDTAESTPAAMNGERSIPSTCR